MIREEEKTLVSVTEEIFDELNKMLGDLMKMTGFDLDSVADLDDEMFIMVKRYLVMMKKAKDLSIMQAEKLDKIDEIDKKLDKVLTLTKK
jgi:hypothetical protein